MFSFIYTLVCTKLIILLPVTNEGYDCLELEKKTKKGVQKLEGLGNIAKLYLLKNIIVLPGVRVNYNHLL